ncbi:hypothetical protein SAMN02787099_00275 [Lysinibacillus fusiformis]|nr:hypothetical protein SAMN02787099_00275 [Lysinibacillus fusiformis]
MLLMMLLFLLFVTVFLFVLVGCFVQLCFLIMLCLLMCRFWCSVMLFLSLSFFFVVSGFSISSLFLPICVFFSLSVRWPCPSDLFSSFCGCCANSLCVFCSSLPSPARQFAPSFFVKLSFVFVVICLPFWLRGPVLCSTLLFFFVVVVFGLSVSFLLLSLVWVWVACGLNLVLFIFHCLFFLRLIPSSNSFVYSFTVLDVWIFGAFSLLFSLGF